MNRTTELTNEMKRRLILAVLAVCSLTAGVLLVVTRNFSHEMASMIVVPYEKCGNQLNETSTATNFRSETFVYQDCDSTIYSYDKWNGRFGGYKQFPAPLYVEQGAMPHRDARGWSFLTRNYKTSNLAITTFSLKDKSFSSQRLALAVSESENLAYFGSCGGSDWVGTSTSLYALDQAGNVKSQVQLGTPGKIWLWRPVGVVRGHTLWLSLGDSRVLRISCEAGHVANFLDISKAVGATNISALSLAGSELWISSTTAGPVVVKAVNLLDLRSFLPAVRSARFQGGAISHGYWWTLNLDARDLEAVSISKPVQIFHVRDGKARELLQRASWITADGDHLYFGGLSNDIGVLDTKALSIIQQVNAK
jgi:hypothetical protein